ncbi:DNA protecting protein DprA [Mariprofundus ferrinatatus]|uniref:DNA protecting protein DprA n=1 Tax=Mariprofundus ferrinatatus TaxID=1921087 RepID=A0A2K8L745_9PROT|nr:DNA-processing protein DprA [Mariprofundus ferrinatatus]ATX83083.1 DNA protecting protein DprA [Mariprofundus ferrinatatus]
MAVAAASRQAIAWLRLSLVSGIGPLLGRKLVDAAGSVEGVFSAGDETWSNVAGIGPSLRTALKGSHPEHAVAVLKQCEVAGIRLISPDDDLWPEALKGIDDAPLLLFAKGDAVALNSEKMLAVVGARRASREGALISRRWSRYLSDQGVTIVSGMACGIDAASHGGALEGGSPTIAVLGCGLASLSGEQQAQAEAICRQGCVISEFLPDQGARPEQFPRRNRIIAALAPATLVVEADVRSGSLITARLAAGYGREVFAVPGSLQTGNHAGCHQLIRDGAVLATDPSCIMSELGWDAGKSVRNQKQRSYQPVNEYEAKIVAVLGHERLHLDELTETCGLTLPELSPILLALELQGVIERLPGSRYQLSAE